MNIVKTAISVLHLAHEMNSSITSQIDDALDVLGPDYISNFDNVFDLAMDARNAVVEYAEYDYVKSCLMAANLLELGWLKDGPHDLTKPAVEAMLRCANGDEALADFLLGPENRRLFYFAAGCVVSVARLTDRGEGCYGLNNERYNKCCRIAADLLSQGWTK